MKTFHTDVAVLPERLFTLERCGRYEEAFAELQYIWDDINTFPKVEELPPRLAAEVILRCGALIGFFGHIKQIPDSQEISKNLLTRARSFFLEIDAVEKIAECENYLALAYWRTGELVEAETLIEEALSHPLNRMTDAWIYASLTKSLVYLSLSKYEEVERYLTPIENHFRKFGNAFLNGSFCANLSIALRNLGRKAEAMKYLELARYHHQKSRHQIYLGTVENNLAYLYKSEKRFAQAHRAIDSATKIFRQIKDRTREGFSLDTKAAIFCDEGKFPEALKIIEKAIGILKKSENAAYLIETYLTKSKILLYLDDFSAAVFCLFDAVQLARTKVSEERAAKLVAEFEAALEEKNSSKLAESDAEKDIINENLQLVLPASMARYREFQGVWMKNSYFENIGLPKGSLAVVTKGEVTRGDLVAIMELATDSVVCGFYDAEFGIVCLEGIGAEPQLFDENEIKILGKIVGVCDAGKRRDGKMIVEPINL